MRLSPLLTLALLAGCATTREPLHAPELDARVSYDAGDPLGGTPAPAEVATLELRTEDALVVHARIHVIDELPGERFEPLTDHVRLIVGEGGSEPRALLLTGARLATGAEAAAFADDVAERPPHEAVRAAAFDGLVLPGVTTTLSAAHVRPIEIPGEAPSERRLGIELWREQPAGDAVAIGLVVSDIVEVVEGLDTASPSIARRMRSERLILDVRLEPPYEPVAVFTPARLDPEGKLAYVLVLEVAPPTDDERGQMPERLAAVVDEVHAAATLGAERRAQLELADRIRVRRLRALDGIADVAHQRAALVELAGDVPVAGELALVGDDGTVARLCERLVARSAELRESGADPGTLTWEVEREALRMLVEQQGREELAPEHAALLLRHLGQAGRDAVTLEGTLAASRSLADFDARVLDENRFALEDATPAARVRAHDWLAVRGLAVPDYDPLADVRARRAALSAWSAAEAEAGVSEGNP